MSERQDLLKTVLSWGIIIRADLETIEKIKQYLAGLDVRVIYQRIDAGGLWIVKRKEAEQGG